MHSSLSTVLALGAFASVASAQTYVASFTEYGSGDSFGSGNCNVKSTACGFFDSPGFNAAASQNLFGAGPGQGAGPACGGCWQLTPETDSSGKPLQGASPIVVKVNNLCPAQGNPLCAMTGTPPGGMSAQPSPTPGMSHNHRMLRRDGSTNSLGANVHFDLCIDGGAAKALFGSSGTGLAKGRATRVDCSQWKGGPDQH